MKNIVILSTEPWGKILLSKMHYAIVLSDMGYKVFFINAPAEIKCKKLASVNKENSTDNLIVIDTKSIKGSLFFRYKFFWLYKKINKRYIKAIQKIVNGPIDELWCFDPHTFVNLKSFQAGKSILLLYDFYKGSHVFKAAQTADAIVSISKLILDYYQNTSPPKLLMQHGLSRHFAGIAKTKIKNNDFKIQQNDKIRIGYMGNLLREGMNIALAQKIIQQNNSKEFHFWGPYSLTDNNVTSKYAVIKQNLIDFITFLKEQKHVFLHGVTDQKTLAAELNNMDAFLFLYSADNDMNKASNSHKILEYLSTGKAIIATHVSNYAESDLLIMSKPGNDKNLPELFEKVVNNLSHYNSADQQQKRIAFALDNTYVRQVKKIQSFIYKAF